jgi:hypothetical protein
LDKYSGDSQKLADGYGTKTDQGKEIERYYYLFYRKHSGQGQGKGSLG